MYKFIYDGPVKIFDRCVADHWKAETMAESESKARTNMSYQYKKSHNLSAATKVSLTGNITKIG